MEQQVLEYTRRTPKGTCAVRRLRREGRLPGVLYGHKQDAVPLSVDQESFEQFLREGSRTLTLQDGPRSEMALVKDLQYDALGSAVVHVDFTRIAADETVQVSVPVELVGQAKGVVDGGVLDQVAREASVECLAIAIPEVIRLHIQDMEIDQALHVRDLPVDQGITLLDPPENVVVVIHPPRVEEEEEEAEEGAEDLSAEPEIIGRAEAEEDPAEEKAPE